MSKKTLITSALFTSGLQCDKRLYLDAHRPKQTPAPSELQAMMAEIGTELVGLASTAFPKGTAVEEKTAAAAIAKTEELCRSGKPTVVFQGRFRHADVDVSCDIVIATGDGTLDLFEVKAGVSIKPRHVLDLALQVWVLEALGYKVRRTSIIHLNRRYVHDGGTKLPVHALFKNVDATPRVRRHVARIGGMLDGFRAALATEATLELPTGNWCRAPLACPYLAQCTAEGPDHPLVELPGLTRTQVARLHRDAITTLADVDPDLDGLTPIQRRVLQGVRGKHLATDARLYEEMAECERPLHFVWFDTLLEIQPRYAKTRPWQKLPFLWHRLEVKADGSIAHASFCADGKDDPRQQFVHTLLDATINAHTIVFFPHDVEDRLRELLEDLAGEDKARARAILNSPFLELESLLRHGAYHPDFRGEFDLTTVARALAPDVTTADLEIGDADAAGAAVRKLANTRTRAATRDKLQAGLLAWARRRAEAMFAVWQRLDAERTVQPKS